MAERTDNVFIILKPIFSRILERVGFCFNKLIVLVPVFNRKKQPLVIPVVLHRLSNRSLKIRQELD